MHSSKVIWSFMLQFQISTNIKTGSEYYNLLFSSFIFWNSKAQATVENQSSDICASFSVSRARGSEILRHSDNSRLDSFCQSYSRWGWVPQKCIFRGCGLANECYAALYSHRP